MNWFFHSKRKRFWLVAGLSGYLLAFFIGLYAPSVHLHSHAHPASPTTVDGNLPVSDPHPEGHLPQKSCLFCKVLSFFIPFASPSFGVGTSLPEVSETPLPGPFFSSFFLSYPVYGRAPPFSSVV